MGIRTPDLWILKGRDLFGSQVCSVLTRFWLYLKAGRNTFFGFSVSDIFSAFHCFFFFFICKEEKDTKSVLGTIALPEKVSLNLNDPAF